MIFHRNIFRMPLKHKLVPRITQLDAIELNSGVREALNEQFTAINKFLAPGTLSSLQAELQLLLDLLIFLNSVLKNGRTFGQVMLNLKYQQKLTKRDKTVHFLTSVIIPYLTRRFEHLKRLNLIWQAGKAFHLVNLLLFLWEGCYPTVTDRLTRAQHVYFGTSHTRVTYNFMMRELLWHTFMEFLTFSLPLVNIEGMKRRVKGWWQTPGRSECVEALVLNAKSTCVVCQARPNTPCRIALSCAHVACFICLQAKIMADQGWCCPVCYVTNTAVHQLQRAMPAT